MSEVCCEREGEMMDAMKEAAEIIRPGNLTHYDSPHLKKVISELLRLLALERRDHAMEIRHLREDLQA